LWLTTQNKVHRVPWFFFTLQHKAVVLISVLKRFENNSITLAVITDLETQIFLSSNSRVVTN